MMSYGKKKIPRPDEQMQSATYSVTRWKELNKDHEVLMYVKEPEEKELIEKRSITLCISGPRQ